MFYITITKRPTAKNTPPQKNEEKLNQKIFVIVVYV
jgi:hypothetical protein